MKSKILIFFIICLLLGKQSEAQDIHFSQPLVFSTFLSPAAAGTSGKLRGVVGYRNQWNSVASPYKTFAFSFDMNLGERSEKGFWGAGLNFLGDEAGSSRMGTTQGNLLLAYHVRINEQSTLGGGLLGGFAQRKIDYTDLTWGNQFDGNAYNASLPTNEPTGVEKLSYFDIGAGLGWTYKKGEAYMTGNDHLEMNAGMALFHFPRPDYAFPGGTEKLYSKATLYGNSIIGISNTNLSVAPAIMVNLQGNSFEGLGGSMFRYTISSESKYTGILKRAMVSAGLFYRMRDAFVISSLLEFSDYAIGVSYDVNVSELTAASSGKGGVEITLQYNALK